MNLVTSIFGTHSDRELKRIKATVDKVFSYEEEYAALDSAALVAKTQEFKDRYQAGETLDDLLPEAFATVREAAWRVLGMKPYRVQVIGGIILHQGRIAEMKTGEGKTLVATMPVYLNALTGKGVHVVTVNDYLAKRDSEWMGKVYRYLGLSVGLIIHDKNPRDRQKEYACDIVYGTNNEFSFDYLRDNMVIRKENLVQRELNYAIVDEVDSILIDEARTPLIISGRGTESSELYNRADSFVKTLKQYVVVETDDKTWTISLVMLIMFLMRRLRHQFLQLTVLQRQRDISESRTSRILIISISSTISATPLRLTETSRRTSSTSFRTAK